VLTVILRDVQNETSSSFNIAIALRDEEEEEEESNVS
jgi:hypothetical protein